MPDLFASTLGETGKAFLSGAIILYTAANKKVHLQNKTDGFGSKFYKKMAKSVVGPVTNMFTESFERGTLPPTQNLAHNPLISKKDKPSDQCASYRPISLLGVDCKLLSKLLARRLKEVLPVLVKPDQTGFVKNRCSYSNVRRLLNVIQFSHSTKKKVLSVSLDAEKAFDCIEWESIHPSIFFTYLGPGCGRSCLSRDTQTSLSPDTSFSSSGRIPRRSQASWVT